MSKNEPPLDMFGARMRWSGGLQRKKEVEEVVAFVNTDGNLNQQGGC